MDELAEMGLDAGRQMVPVFVRGHAACRSVGEILTPVDPPEKWYLVAHPGVSIPTPVILKILNSRAIRQKRSIENVAKNVNSAMIARLSQETFSRG